MKKSAGILVYRNKNNKIEVLLVHPGGPYWQNKDENYWSIPKGEIELTNDVSLGSSPEATQPELGFRQSFRLNESQETSTTNFTHRNCEYSAVTNEGKQIDKDVRSSSRQSSQKFATDNNKVRKSSRESLQEFVKIIKETAIREFEEETGLKIDEQNKEKIFYLGEFRSSNKILYVFVLEKDFGDNFEIRSNFIEIEWPPKSGKIIKIPEVDKGGYFDLETAKEKLVNYQKKIVNKLKKIILKA